MRSATLHHRTPCGYPRATSYYVTRRPHRDAEHGPKAVRPYPERMQSSHLSNHQHSQSGPWALLSGQARPVSPTLGVHVGDVLGLGAEEEMDGIHAGRVVAAVEDLKAVWNGLTMIYLPGKAVRQKRLPVATDLAVPIRECRA